MTARRVARHVFRPWLAGPAETRLRAQLAALALDGRTVPCTGSESWTSDNFDERAAAILLCRCCPALDACGEAASEIRPSCGIWAGRNWAGHGAPDEVGPTITEENDHR